jgi:hypothetical protein
MSTIDPTGEHFMRAEKLRQLRQKLAGEIDILRREELLKQIEEIEEQSKSQLKPRPSGQAQ